MEISPDPFEEYQSKYYMGCAMIVCWAKKTISILITHPSFLKSLTASLYAKANLLTILYFTGLESVSAKTLPEPSFEILLYQAGITFHPVSQIILQIG
ncbi:hypothetical protein BaLi_c12980 [Bacillus paralicheniformis ATCC 9945a]|jgi:hypothetical protein|nr:hypothetical protein BaLi_c12980 [Bacillus paralicheniformis ATCC 9945a]